MKRWVKLIIGLFLIVVTIVPSVFAVNIPAVTVGRLSYIEGDLLRYVPEVKDWVLMVKDVTDQNCTAVIKSDRISPAKSEQQDKEKRKAG